jgi:PAS domain S-box-containing protein
MKLALALLTIGAVAAAVAIGVGPASGISPAGALALALIAAGAWGGAAVAFTLGRRLAQLVRDQQRLTERVQDAEARFGAVLDAAGDGLVRCHGARVELVNGSFATLFGLGSPESAVGRTLTDFIAPGMRERVAAEMARIEHGEAPSLLVEADGVRSDGGHFALELRAARYGGSAERGVMVSVRDVSERKRAEAQGAESVRLREQLLQSQRMETLGTLAAGIAHDFNNLLTGITGFVELAATSLPPGHEAVELLQEAKQGATNARDLVRRILVFSRRSRETQRTPTDLGAVVRETMPLIAAALPGNVSVSVEIAESSAPVLADAGQIQQMLLNLCTRGGNSFEIQARSLRLAVSLHERSAASGAEGGARCMRLTISDTSLDDASSWAATGEAVREGEGNVPVRAVVQQIVSRHRGTMGVANTAEGGTIYTIDLPTVAEERLTAVTRDVEPVVPSSPRKTLVVDDDETIAAVLRLALTRAGYSPEVFTSPLRAWSRFAQAPGDFQLLMVDQFMPEMSGAEFIARARSVKPGLPSILISGRFEESDVAIETLGARVSALKKPFDIAEMLREIQSVLGR